MAEPISGTAIAIYAALTAATIGASYHQQGKVKKATEDRADAESAASNFKAARERRAQVQKMLQTQGSIENVSAATGTSSSSAAVGGLGQAANQAARNIGTINSNQVMGQNLASLRTKEMNAANPTAFQTVLGGINSVYAPIGQNALGGAMAKATEGEE